MFTKQQGIIRGLLISAAIWAPAQAYAQESYQFDLPAQELGRSLREVTARANWQLFAAADDIKGKKAPALNGTFTAFEAIDMLLRDSGLTGRIEDNTVVIKRAVRNGEQGMTPEPTIIVTGSRIKGSPPVVPVTTITSDDIKMSGQADLGEVARALPQSFGGGQNPGIGNTQGAANENANANGASTFNLRGIGPNGTLTLLNGNRFGYTGVSAAIDVSAIPVAAVERIEIVADGSSAIYGADAVAGVVNIILKSDYSGVSASARVGASTDGGNTQQQYGVLAGTSWSSGSLLAAYDFSSNTAINAEDRTYTSTTNPQTDIYPAIDRHNLLVRARQELGTGISFEVDAIFKTAVSGTETGFTLDRAPDDEGFTARTAAETLGIAPSLDIDLGSNWSARIAGFYGTDRTDGLTRFYSAGAQSGTSVRQYDNQNHSVEAGLEGELIELPAGPVRVAVGGGFRSIYFSALSSSVDIEKRRKSYFGYGEAFVPLIDRDSEGVFLKSASITGALRYEDYSDSGRIIVPRVGLTVEPVNDVRLGLSWGRSFKLPTLFQQYSGYVAVLVGVSGYGTTFPPGSNYIIAFGPNSEVGPERSENWTASVTLAPVEDMEISASYFSIDYQDRVAPPLASSAGALTNPIYSSLVTLNPNASTQGAIIDSALGGLQNATAGAYDPSQVVAILDARDRNVAQQQYKGVDISLRYGISITDGKKLLLTGAATWLDSEQQLLPGLPVTPLSGRIFQSPKFRARGGATLDTGPVSAALFMNHSGGVKDDRLAIAVDHGSLTTFDLTGRFELGQHVEIVLNALNIFNAKPDRIFTSSPFDTPFDTTNYSAAGRFVGLTVTGKW